MSPFFCFLLFFFNDTATTEIYTLSLHDALPISLGGADPGQRAAGRRDRHRQGGDRPDRKSTRLNSSHVSISYAVFCLKKKNELHPTTAAQAIDSHLTKDRRPHRNPSYEYTPHCP